jgi:hypothetical protein
MFGSLGLGLSLGGRRVGGAGNKPATFSIPANYADTGTKRINFSEPVTIKITGGVTLAIDGIPYQSGETIPVATTYHTLTINNPGEDAGTITFGKRKQITYLYLYSIGSSVITGDITGMKLTTLYLRNLSSSVITGNITGMKLTYLRLDSLGSSVITGDITGMRLTTLYLYSLGSSVITGDITGMKLTSLHLYYIGSSVITGDITGMKLTFLYLYDIGSSSVAITGDITGMELTNLYLNNIGSSLTYGTNPLNITNNNGVQLVGDTVFSASEYIQLFADAATCVTDGKWTASTKVMTISGGENPGWSNVEEYYDTIVGGGVLVKVPIAWESGDDPFPPETLNP